jgi:hypothetical protein
MREGDVPLYCAHQEHLQQRCMDRGMSKAKKNQGLLIAGPGLLFLGLLVCGPARADFELKDGEGRVILLKDDGTWRYRDAKPPAPSAADPAKDLVPAELALEQRVDAPGGCRLDLALTNRLPYEIRSLVPEFSAYRAGDVVYSTQSAGFGFVRPGDSHRRAVQFPGIACGEVVRVQVGGGDRCEMGELNKFSDVTGACLARLKVLPSTLLPFGKAEKK